MLWDAVFCSIPFYSVVLSLILQCSYLQYPIFLLFYSTLFYFSMFPLLYFGEKKYNFILLLYSDQPILFYASESYYILLNWTTFYNQVFYSVLFLGEGGGVEMKCQCTCTMVKLICLWKGGCRVKNSTGQFCCVWCAVYNDIYIMLLGQHLMYVILIPLSPLIKIIQYYLVLIQYY